ncbi:MAG: kynureninase [Pseudomonadota bacterium]
MSMESRDEARALDAADPLAGFRDRYVLPDGVIYLDGNSLGPMAASVPGEMAQAVEQEWGQGLISSWNDAGWWSLPVTLGEKIAPLVGAAPGQIVVSDSTSVNIYKAVQAGLQMRPDRNVLVTEAGGFPTDLYITEGVMQSERRVERRLIANPADIDRHLDADVAVLLLSHVDYRSGELLDMKAITERAQAAGAIVIWDLCHSAGVVPMSLDECNVDLAVGCTYKYLNGGPGAQSWIYAPKRLHGEIRQPLSGWWGHAAPFEFEQSYRAEPGIKAFLCGSQAILGMRALSAALDVFADVDMALVRAKSIGLTGTFIELVEAECGAHGFGLFSPRDAAIRGSQVALTHPDGYAIIQALIARGVIGDFRMPDILRFGFAPLYIGYEDVWNAVAILRDIMETGAWKAPEFAVKAAVT